MGFAHAVRKRHLVGVGVSQCIGAAGGASHSDQDDFSVMSDERLSVRSELLIVEKMHQSRMLLFCSKLRAVLWVHVRVEGHDLKKLGVWDLLIERVKALHLLAINIPGFLIGRKLFDEQIPYAGIQRKADLIHRIRWRLLAKIAVTQGSHQRQLVEVQGAETILCG